ncbi:hypothetical protein M427DRAFT_142050 [Gonapodya prolifera JEL478]|uniref:Uncharacterized protein n=1 Tax=Gonapodya prolifera (strain JEL478) TaxID=1344416 RepID=A0A139AXU0_GONPJ|nr:hypothetical protein M427DRAFT_142050 [Gonapodya prolifera JEL478]|eukprot:KXS21562.1 hypothetical protein M427DRAFT_142050 [Gonapodya prolifera JEL478]
MTITTLNSSTLYTITKAGVHQTTGTMNDAIQNDHNVFKGAVIETAEAAEPTLPGGYKDKQSIKASKDTRVRGPRQARRLTMPTDGKAAPSLDVRKRNDRQQHEAEVKQSDGNGSESSSYAFGTNIVLDDMNESQSWPVEKPAQPVLSAGERKTLVGLPDVMDALQAFVGEGGVNEETEAHSIVEGPQKSRSTTEMQQHARQTVGRSPPSRAGKVPIAESKEPKKGVQSSSDGDALRNELDISKPSPIEKKEMAQTQHNSTGTTLGVPKIPSADSAQVMPASPPASNPTDTEDFSLAEKNDAQTKLQRKEAQIQTLLNQIRRDTVTKQEMEKKLNLAQKENSETRMELDNLRREANTRSVEFQKAKDLIKDQSNQLDQMQAKFQARQSDFDLMKRERDEKAAELQYMGFHKQEVEQLRVELRSAIDISCSYLEKQRAADEEIVRLKDQAQQDDLELKALQNSRDELVKEVQDLTAQLSDTAASRYECSQLQAVVDRLNSRIQSGSAENEQLRTILGSRSDEIRRLEEVAATEKFSLRQLKELKTDNARLGEDLSFWRSQKREFETRIRSLMEDVKSLESIVETERDRIYAQDAIIERLKVSRNDLEAELTRLKERYNFSSNSFSLGGQVTAQTSGNVSIDRYIPPTSPQTLPQKDDHPYQNMTGYQGKISERSRTGPPPGLSSPVSSSQSFEGTSYQQPEAKGSSFSRRPLLATQQPGLTSAQGCDDRAVRASNTPNYTDSDPKEPRDRRASTICDDESVADTIVEREQDEARPEPPKFAVWFIAEIRLIKGRVKFTIYKDEPPKRLENRLNALNEQMDFQPWIVDTVRQSIEAVINGDKRREFNADSF